MTECQKQLEVAFRSLPFAAPPPGRDIPFDMLIPSIARELCLMQPNRYRRPSPEGTRRKLAALQKRARELNEDMPAALYLPLELRLLIIRLAYAEAPKFPKAGRTGAPKKALAAQVARTTARYYYLLTDKRPTRISPIAGGKAYGAFIITFLADIFRILGIEASVESQAKKAIRYMEETYPRN
jgi:hypothetical protein